MSIEKFFDFDMLNNDSESDRYSSEKIKLINETENDELDNLDFFFYDKNEFVVNAIVKRWINANKNFDSFFNNLDINVCQFLIKKGNCKHREELLRKTIDLYENFENNNCNTYLNNRKYEFICEILLNLYCYGEAHIGLRIVPLLLENEKLTNAILNSKNKEHITWRKLYCEKHKTAYVKI